MSQVNNPFIRGYRNLRAERAVLITCDDDSSPLWRPVHPCQASLPDDRIVQSNCRFGGDFAWIDGPDTPDEPEGLDIECPSDGFARGVVYGLIGEDIDGRPVHAGDFYSAGAAREAIRRLSFETGFYSRCWEINSAHLCEASRRYLAAQAENTTPAGVLFEVFPMPCSPAIGVKLIAAPWTDEHLGYVEGITAGQLRNEFLGKGVPEVLFSVLDLAAQADIRLLIFDADAPRLEGLPVYME